MRREERLSLRKFLAPEFVFGSGARKFAAHYARTLSLAKVTDLLTPQTRATRITFACKFHKRLFELGLKQKNLALLPKRALEDPYPVTNHRPATLEEVERIYGEAI